MKVDISEDWEEIEIENFDIWSLDHTLALIIHPALIKFRENKNGHPYVDEDDVIEDLRVATAFSETTIDDLSIKKWNYVLDEMIFSFKEIIESNNSWSEEHSDRITNGLRLFGKYYRHLWD